MAASTEHVTQLPSSSTFSFSAPFPLPTPASASPVSSALKQRRVSLALPSSPRLFPAFHFRDDTGVGVHSGESSSSLGPEKKGKMRRIESDRLDEEVVQLTGPSEKKIRKKWTTEETQMLVDGCNKWGVGNWKSILNDPQFKFDGRSPVDLKDRFRTYFPDAYKQHYPNAKTHLSSKIRSALPDGSSIFEKTRSKKRRPFTEEEDRALKAGYDKHGTVWATIVKDPIFQEQNRRSTDLRDRFRNAFPDLYEAAGYKPRASAKKKKGDMPHPMRAATDDQISLASSTGPIRKRRHTTQGMFRGGTKSVPESTTCSEDEDSSDEDEMPGSVMDQGTQTSPPEDTASISAVEGYPVEIDMQADAFADTSSIQDFIPGSELSEITDSSQSQAWASGLDTPLHSGPWSSATNAASPTSSHLSSDYFVTHSPFHRRPDGAHIMIGKSAWGPQDWLSANPRLDPSAAPSSSSSFLGGVSPTPSSPFSFAHLSHGVLDRYDLFPPSVAHDFASEAGVGDTHSTFSDPDMFPTNSFRGFTHHSNYAGDLIFGARTHQPQQPFDYGPGFGFGSAGLGLSGMQPQPHGLPLHAHTPALPGIDEIELTSITLEDQADGSAPMETTETALPKDDSASVMDLSVFGLPPQTLDEIVGLSLPQEFNATPPGTPQTTSRSSRSQPNTHYNSSHNRSVSVPPTEHRAVMPRAPQTQLLKSRPLQPPPRSTSVMDVMPVQGPGVDDMTMQHAHAYPLGPPYQPDGWRPQGDMYDLPFLDLHYYTSSGHNPAIAGLDGSDTAQGGLKPDVDLARQGQALDLAESYASSRALGVMPSLTQQMSLMSHSAASTPPATNRMIPMHHRGQSAVSPQDLLLRKSNDNKRKRSSWDGGAH
ncbi:hypothetical protein DAEQUDRAFT_692283 [Daedalea quercina L-15889]|uniref:Myb-like domain-containing protein n=1 Tax=Daedalea quercina L-15889 TaxID=1314783 RepID=A0A165PU21_9APHY|nr:hypothetical protein DAEQUDRAFT_692283 [Daedalea quercina L-15889]